MEKLKLQDFYNWYNINYGGDLAMFRNYKVALQNNGVVKVRGNTFVFEPDDALKYDAFGELTESLSRTLRLHLKEDNDIDDTDAHDDYIYYLEKKLNRIKSVDKLRKTLEELGFTQTDGIDYNTWDNYYGDDASFDTWEKDDIVVKFWYDEKYRTIETRVW